MTQKTFSWLLRAAILIAFLCCAAVYGLYVPAMANEVKRWAAEYSGFYLPGLIFVELTALPILAAFVLAWRIAVDIGRDRSFSRENARRMKIISFLALGDVGYFWIGVLVFSFLGAASGPSLLMSVLVGAAGLILAVCAGALSHLILKAAVLREENDLTV